MALKDKYLYHLTFIMIINFIISECINNSLRFRMKSHIQLQSCVDTTVFINALDGRHDKSSFGTSPAHT